MIQRIIIYLKKLHTVRSIPDDFTGKILINCQLGYVNNIVISESIKIA